MKFGTIGAGAVALAFGREALASMGATVSVPQSYVLILATER